MNLFYYNIPKFNNYPKIGNNFMAVDFCNVENISEKLNLLHFESIDNLKYVYQFFDWLCHEFFRYFHFILVALQQRIH